MSWEWWLAYGSMALLMVVGILLMIIILLQRGRGGGLAGAFGGAGGQSAFGTRAGDVFTKITAVMAILWVVLAGVSRFALEPAATHVAVGFQTEEELEATQTPGGAFRGGSETPEDDMDEDARDEDPVDPDPVDPDPVDPDSPTDDEAPPEAPETP